MPSDGDIRGQRVYRDTPGAWMLENILESPITNVLDRQVFDSSGTWNKPSLDDPEQLTVIALLVGGGGGGGATFESSTLDKSTASGGGGGSFAGLVIPFAELSSTEDVTVGSGGNGGSVTSSSGTSENGNDGGDTSFAGMGVAGGGKGGKAYVDGTAIASRFTLNSPSNSGMLLVENTATASVLYEGGIGMLPPAVYAGGSGGSATNKSKTYGVSSSYAGNGGDSVSDEDSADAENGSAPGGGGGGDGNPYGGSGGNGAAGRAIIVVVKKEFIQNGDLF